MTNGAAVLDAYVPSINGPSVNPQPKPQSLNIHFVDRMTEYEFTPHWTRPLAANVSTHVLDPFEPVWSKGAVATGLKRLSSKPVRTPQVSLALANLYHRLGRRRQISGRGAPYACVGEHSVRACGPRRPHSENWPRV